MALIDLSTEPADVEGRFEHPVDREQAFVSPGVSRST